MKGPQRDEITKKKQWENAMKKAKGEKVLDNTQLLKKSLKKEKKMKAKSTKQWKERKEGEKNEQIAKQKQRAKNNKEHLEKR